jgi:hypothetical protein
MTTITSKYRLVQDYLGKHSILIIVMIIVIISFGVLASIQEIDERRQQGEDRLLISLNHTLNKLQLQESKNNQELNLRIVNNQKLIITLANNSLANQKYIISHFDNITDGLIYLIDLARNNSANNLNLTKFNRAAIVHSDDILAAMARRFNLTIEPFNASHIH